MTRPEKLNISFVAKTDNERVSRAIHLNRKDEEWVYIKAQAYV